MASVIQTVSKGTCNTKSLASAKNLTVYKLRITAMTLYRNAMMPNTNGLFGFQTFLLVITNGFAYLQTLSSFGMTSVLEKLGYFEAHSSYVGEGQTQTGRRM